MHHRGHRRYVLGLGVLILTLFSLKLCANTVHAGDLPLETRDDAQLRDVTFIDSNSGWVVGDRGVILHTDDGGLHWHQQQSSVNDRLESVHFIDPQIGWSVGGRAEPYTHRTSGLVLGTRDGGETWTRVSGITVPWLKEVHFLDKLHGWALGDASAMYPTGIFRTDDAGRSWTPIPSGMRGAWIAGDFRDWRNGVAAGYDGALAVISAPQVQASRTPELGPRPLRALRMASSQNGWLAGDGGLLLQTADGGRTWQSPSQPLPPGVPEMFDFSCLAVQEADVWIAGTPGSQVLHSGDGGKTWDLFPTGQALPIRALAFADAEHGWAVGDLGTILCTQDGGRQWHVQRRGGERLAILGLFSEPCQIPFELFAYESGGEGYLAAVELIGRRDTEAEQPDQPPNEDLASQAMSDVGACGADQAWQFPLREAGLVLPTRTIVEGWNRANDGRAVAVLEERIVRKIRQWRPEVIITDPPCPGGEHCLARIVNQVVLTAVRAAADPTMYPDHITIAGLKPWAAKKVFSRADNVQRATVPLTTTQLAPRLGRSIADQAMRGQAIVGDDFQMVPVRTGFQLLTSDLPHAADHKDIFGGILLQPGGEARRKLGLLRGDIRTLQRVSERHRNLQQLLERSEDSPVAAAGWLGQVNQMTRGLPTQDAAQVLFHLGARYRDTGHGELAASVWEQLIERYPDSGLTEKAMRWLIRYYASGEIGWQLRRNTHFDNHVVRAVVADRAARELQPEQAIESSANERVAQTSFQAAGTSSTASVGAATERRSGTALLIGKRVQRTLPQLFAEPAIQFPMSVAYRVTGLPRDAERSYHRLSAMSDASAWSAAAQTELWLSHRRGSAPKPVYTCRKGVPRPFLDGQLDDATWQNAPVIELKSPYHDDVSWPAAVILASDDQFLFLAVSCRKAPGREYPVSPGVRTRDPDLTGSDRVELYLDIDRDYQSYYRLTVDYRGWTGEACNGDVHFDPKWYAAAAQTDQDWTVEAAIAWRELVPQPPTELDAWAVGVQRVVPTVGLQSFTQPAAVTPRGEGFALLMFK